MRVRVETNAACVASAFQKLIAGELQKAQAIALTKAGVDVRNHLRASMARTFTLRSRGLPNAIVSNAAEKKDWPRIYAEVGIRGDSGFPAAFLTRHVTGEDKEPERNAKSILVPTSIVKRTGGGRIPKSAQPRELITRDMGYTDSKYFYRRLINAATGRAKKARAGQKRRLFVRTKKAKIREVWHVPDLALAKFREVFPTHWQRELDLGVERAKAKAAKACGFHR